MDVADRVRLIGGQAFAPVRGNDAVEDDNGLITLNGGCLGRGGRGGREDVVSWCLFTALAIRLWVLAPSAFSSVVATRRT